MTHFRNTAFSLSNASVMICFYSIKTFFVYSILYLQKTEKDTQRNAVFTNSKGHIDTLSSVDIENTVSHLEKVYYIAKER